MVSEKLVFKKLKEVIDPEIGMNIVDLGLIYGVKIKDGQVKVMMTLTTPGCPLAAFFPEEVEKKLKEIAGVKKAKVELTFDPPWSPERMKKR